MENRHLKVRGAWAAALVWALAGLVTGCTPEPKPPEQKVAKYAPLPYAEVPEYLKGTLMECTVLQNDSAYPVSGYGLVVNLAGTGNNTGIPSSVRNYMIDQMVKHGFDTWGAGEEYKRMRPERILEDPRTAIVEVWAAIPPGARKGQKMDVLVRAMPTGNTTSLKGARLYSTRLAENGANPMDPAGAVQVLGLASGDVSVNPASVIGSATRPAVKDSLRKGVIMDGGEYAEDRPLVLRLCEPSWNTSHAIQTRVTTAMQGQDGFVAQAIDEGKVYLLVPERYNGDWKHFIDVVRHMYVRGSPDFTARKARELVEVAMADKDARLADLSLCWEAMGPAALPFIQVLYTNPRPEVAFHAARAGAYLGDMVAQEKLLLMAAGEEGQFQMDAVKVLGDLPQTPRVDRMLASLLNAKRAQVRVDAYRILARHGDHRIASGQVGGFMLDLVASDGPPLIYATSTGTPRIALFGRELSVALPLTFAAMNTRFTISSNDDPQKPLSLYYRAPEPADPIKLHCGTAVNELIVHLGAEDGLRFDYADVIGVLQALTARKDIPAAFVLQEAAAERPAGEVIEDYQNMKGRPVNDKPVDTGEIILAPEKK